MAQGAPLRIGIFGGTFDPVHVGHLVAALEARQALALDTVLMVVANDPWQKRDVRTVTGAEERFAVVAQAVAHVDGLEASRLEIDRGGPSYTVETVIEVAAENPGAEMFLVVGEDVAAELDTWERAGELAQLVTLVVVDRGGVRTGTDPAGWRVMRVSIPVLEISSSDLRSRLADGRNVTFLIPDDAIRCITGLGLYDAGR